MPEFKVGTNASVFTPSWKVDVSTSGFIKEGHPNGYFARSKHFMNRPALWGGPGRGVSQVLRPHRVRRLALQGWKPEAAAGGSETMGNGPWK